VKLSLEKRSAKSRTRQVNSRKKWDPHICQRWYYLHSRLWWKSI